MTHHRHAWSVKETKTIYMLCKMLLRECESQLIVSCDDKLYKEATLVLASVTGTQSHANICHPSNGYR